MEMERYDWEVQWTTYQEIEEAKAFKERLKRGGWYIMEELVNKRLPGEKNRHIIVFLARKNVKVL